LFVKGRCSEVLCSTLSRVTFASSGTHQPGLLPSFLLSGFTAGDGAPLRRLGSGVVYGFAASSARSVTKAISEHGSQIAKRQLQARLEVRE